MPLRLVITIVFDKDVPKNVLRLSMYSLVVEVLSITVFYLKVIRRPKSAFGCRSVIQYLWECHKTPFVVSAEHFGVILGNWRKTQQEGFSHGLLLCFEIISTKTLRSSID